MSMIQEIKIPSKVSEITFNEWSDFRDLENKWIETKEYEDLLMAVNIFIEESILYNLPIGGFSDSLDTEKPTLLGIYLYLNSLISNYVPKPLSVPFSCEFKGETYFLNAADTALIMGLKPITVGEGITLCELSKNAGETFEELYNLNLGFVAVILRKEAEKLPINVKDRERFITERKIMWQDAPMDMVLDLKVYLDVVLASILSILPPSIGKQSKESVESWEKHGWHQLLPNAAKSMNVPATTAWEESFETALYSSSHSTL